MECHWHNRIRLLHGKKKHLNASNHALKKVLQGAEGGIAPEAMAKQYPRLLEMQKNRTRGNLDNNNNKHTRSS